MERSDTKNDRLDRGAPGGESDAARHGKADWIFAILLLQPVSPCGGQNHQELCGAKAARAGRHGDPRYERAADRHCGQIRIFVTAGDDACFCGALRMHAGSIPQCARAAGAHCQKGGSLSRAYCKGEREEYERKCFNKTVCADGVYPGAQIYWDMGQRGADLL